MSRLAHTTSTRPLVAARSLLHIGRSTASAAQVSTPRLINASLSRISNPLTASSRPASHGASSKARYDVSAASSSTRTLVTSTSLPSSSDQVDSDIVIIGGGVVGLGLACDLVASHSVSSSSDAQPITLIEASDLTRLRSWNSDRAAHLSSTNAASSSSSTNIISDGLDWENRVISLTSENLNWLKRIGVYPYLVEHRLRPITSMRVWDGLSGALLDFDSSDLASPNTSSSSQISVMVEISNLQQAMLSYLEHGPGKRIVTILDNAKVDSIIPQSKVDHHSTESIEQDPWPLLQLSTGTAVQARLLVGADGPNSPVRKYAGIGNYGWPYDRHGLVATLRCKGLESGEPKVDHSAYQRFLPSGTIAFLPLSDRSASMVWTLAPQVAAALTQLHKDTLGSVEEPLARMIDAAFRLPWSYIDRLFERVVAFTKHPLPQGEKRNWSWLDSEIPTEAEWVERGLGGPLPESGTGEVPPKILSVDANSVAAFPLNLKHADAYLGASLNGSSLLPSGLLAGAMAAVGFAAEGAGQGSGRGRTVLVGDAAHTIHPLAGQGLNLGIADVRSLSGTLKQALGAGADVGSYNALKGYARERYWENQKMLSAVDHLHWVFAATPVPMSQQMDGGKEQRERDGLVKSAIKEVLGRGVVWGRSTGMEVINELGFVKNFFMRQAGSTTTTTSSNTPWSTSRRRFSTQSRGSHTLGQSPAASMMLCNRKLGQMRHHSSQTARRLASDAYTSATRANSCAATSWTPSLSTLTSSQVRALQDMLRVDHSGEIAANTIYQGQADMFGALGDTKNRDLSIEMWQTEKKHLEVMRALLRQHNVRPSLLLPVWSIAGRILGSVTALMGPRSAMACTEAVESVIGEHYDDQLKELRSILEKEGVLKRENELPEESGVQERVKNEEKEGEDKVHPSLPLLSDIIKEFRDDELEHLDTAVENESQQAAGHALLSAVIAAGCRGAIRVASRI
ncbi:related to Ubiquinone biosynthesis protein COQ6 and COQ7 [Melanopsichium pennsylvanicum]|uniref:5-demethoxyubiquinone hydroxylase, mitochondrial n=2 Tax=Melanopsichium pennsylvanicum TaxID=63383 RepID=A0AAJ5C4L6_9BASI|nr:related to Ubiquinone biosynthesis protein COQ6 and COQ7 [Melanopsichium pennsylvanicum 4]SNX83639.1 related to Ubiquinone biosynthesis protein COQ6 and COQ7 [Melanopsichium pennsylvanicum]